MDTSDFDTKINDLKNQMETLRKEMESSCRGFINASHDFAKNWFQETVEETVKSNPEITKRNQANLKNMKSELKTLINELPELIEKHLNVDKYWVHRGEIPETESFSEYQLPRRLLPPNKLAKPVNEVLGYVGQLLIRYHFANTVEREEWKVDESGRVIRNSDYALDWSQPMIIKIKQYAGLHNKITNIKRLITDTEKQKAEAEAKDLWDRA